MSSVNDKIRASIEKLFAEPFEPLWMKRKRQAQLEAEQEIAALPQLECPYCPSVHYQRYALTRHVNNQHWEEHRLAELKKTIQERADLQWRLEAEKSHQRILKNCNGIYHTA